MLVSRVATVACLYGFLGGACSLVFAKKNALNVTNIPQTVHQLSPTHFKSLGAQKVSIKHGPYTVPGTGSNGGMQSYISVGVKKPCSDCFITYMQANLEFPNGTYANSNTSMWLHHMVLLTLGAGRTDVSCPSFPLQRFFASGNERTKFDLTANGTSKTGYYLSSSDTIVFEAELMNTLAQARDAVVTVDYEYVPGKPDGFENLKPVWLDIGSCNSSYITPTNTAVSEYVMSPAYTAAFDGKLMGTGGHLHDGGMHIEVLKNSKEVICDSKAAYGGSPGYVESMQMPGMPGMTMEMLHISDMSTCILQQDLKKGDTLGVRAYYNMTMHPGMLTHDNTLEPIMGIALVYVK